MFSFLLILSVNATKVKMTDILDISGSVDFSIEDEGEKGILKLKKGALRRKGRGFESRSPTKLVKEKYDFINSEDSDDRSGPQKSVEGWILFVTSIHEESSEEDIYERFSEYGTIKNVALNLDRRTGFLKGYALIEYETFEEAYSAREALDKSDFLGQAIGVNWCFVKGPKRSTKKRRH
ncbi:RNA-binding protein 8A-like [Agrilus planipennis]|uniref:RNA-binding protein 8A n=1 Tax=Agrilus planipennis TaxID=224129 RepID=A0A1W4WXW2_AGRPL|nr:RNA-binding protein 8A-like [Agrilus planipennis]XP_018328694.1 RNA-binding protein 8A-like [Agrilus planipennis]